MDNWTIWLIIAVLLIIVEVSTQMLWAICVAGGCLAAMIASFCGVGTLWQIVILAGASVLIFVTVLPFYRKVHNKISAKNAATGMDALIGRKAIVTHEIKPGKTGRARIDGDFWQVVAPDAVDTIPKGDEVEVTSYDSIILTVKKIME